MSKLLRVIQMAYRDARTAEALIGDPRSRRSLRTDPEGAMLAFELRAPRVGDETGERQTQVTRRDRRARTVALG
jgi:hypothetical protein